MFKMYFYITILFISSSIFIISQIYCQEQLPFEEKAKYEKFLSQKIDEVLIKLLGPNQAKAIVETEMDFTKTEKLSMRKKKAKNKFKLDSQAGDVSGMEYLMPGFGLPTGNNNKERSYN